MVDIALTENLVAHARGAVLRRFGRSDGRSQRRPLLDAAVALIPQAKAEERKSQEASVSAEKYIREWWSALTG